VRKSETTDAIKIMASLRVPPPDAQGPYFQFSVQGFLHAAHQALAVPFYRQAAELTAGALDSIFPSRISKQG